MENLNNENLAMDWDDSIENESGDFIILDEGDYNFKVTNFERGRFPGSTKLPSCPKATISVEVKTNKGIAMARFDLLLCRSLEWKLCSFFRCIGQKKHGEKLKMNWNAVLGSTGRAHFKPKEYENSKGEKKTVNDVERFIDYNERQMKGNEESSALDINPDDLPF